MDNSSTYPVFFECYNLHPDQKKEIENYFNTWTSSAGSCGSLKRESEHIYSITFRNKKDQQEVLGKTNHIVNLTDGCSLTFTAQSSLEAATSPSNVTHTATQQNSKQFSNSSAPPRAPISRRIVILGKTGDGKSSFGNTIFGTKQFDICDGFSSNESPCQAKTQTLRGKKITLIDTPGFFDTKIPKEEFKPEIVRCITECSPGPHAFLIVIKYGRFTEQENYIFNQITEHFTEEVFKFATIVFTHGDDLHEGKKIKDYMSQNANLRELVRKCGGRCHVIDNKYWNKDSADPYRSNSYQVKKILESIEEIVKANNGNCYTNKMLQAVEEMTQQEEQQIENSSENMSKEEIRQEAKNRVWKYLTKAAGISTGVLLGAFFGAVAAGAAVIVVIISVRKLVAASGMSSAVAALANSAAVAGTAAGVTSTAVAGTAAEVTSAAAAGVTSGVAPGAVGTAIPAVLGTAAVAGAAFGACKGYHAADGAETPLEAAKKTSEALWSSGKDAMATVENVIAKISKLEQQFSEMK